MPAESAPSARCLRLATWNIHAGIGRDRRYDPGRIIAVLQELHADIVALQEVAPLTEHGEFLSQVRSALGVHVAVGRTLTRRAGEYGNALLSRFPFKETANIDLTVGKHEPRGAIDARIDVDGRELRVLSTHLGLRPAERRKQVRKILAALDTDAHSPVVLMGDVNEWYLWGRPVRWLHARFRATPAPATYPAQRPVFALDRIWVRPVQYLRAVSVHRSALAHVASDHLPLKAEYAMSVTSGTTSNGRTHDDAGQGDV
jgi:endonuclease/exonuclease/phosphatase family metal-dependent hydrolase